MSVEEAPEIPYQSEKIIQDTFADTRKKYKDADADYFVGAAEASEQLFFKQVKQAGKTIRREINQVIRLKKPEGEFLLYDEILRSQNNIGKRITHSRRIGFKKDPIFEPVMADSGDIVSGSTDGFEERFQIPFQALFLEKEVEPYMTENVSLIVRGPGRNYGGFSYSQFKDLSFDELVTLGKYGTLTPKIELSKIK